MARMFGPDRSTERAGVDAPPRLAALSRSGLLDSPSEDVFDRATRLASRMLGVPVSLLSVVDGERQFFKAAVGRPAGERETPLTRSFCQHVVGDDAALRVVDARRDPRVADNLAIEQDGVIAYLGVPVHDPDGHALAFVSEHGGTTDLFIIRADGSGQTRLTTHPGTDTRPLWMPF